MERKKLSIICPVYNEQETIPLFYDRLCKQIETWQDRYDTEILFTNNCSTDRTLELIRALRERDGRVRYITLSRNFGYQASVSCGLQHASGDATVIIDVDCEDPPELIPLFLEKWEQGYDIVYGRRDDRPESEALKAARKLFYRLTRVIADNDFIIDMAEFGLMSRRVREEVLKIRTSFPFIRNELGYVGFRRIGIPYTREPRIAGKTNYNLTRMTMFAVAGILTASTYPLRVTALLVPALVLVNLLALLVNAVGTGGSLHWLYVLDLSFLAVSNMFLSVYLARVYKNGMSRALYIVDVEATELDGPA